MEVCEVLATPGFQDVKRGGIIGVSGTTKAAVLVYIQPKDAEFDEVKAIVPKETARKQKNRRYRKNSNTRRVVSPAVEGVPANMRLGCLHSQ